jgi:hypothetical protein
MPDVVHILQGTVAATPGTIASSDGVLRLRDALSCGPVAPIVDLASWEARRLSFWREISDGYVDDDDRGLFVGDPSSLASARKVVIWLGTSLDCQMTLASLPALLRALGSAPSEIELIQFHRNHRGIEILELGMLNPEQIAAHPPAVSLTSADLAELERAWTAIVSPDPEELVSVLEDPHAPLPFFKRALRTLFLRYPFARSGVNGIELRILEATRRSAPSASRVVGDALIAAFNAARAGTGGLDQCGDVWLFWRMLRLGDPRLREPALSLEGSRTTYRDTTVRLTAFGERVLDGNSSFVDANGIDDWIAGVHLDSAAGRVWLHDGQTLVKRP